MVDAADRAATTFLEALRAWRAFMASSTGLLEEESDIELGFMDLAVRLGLMEEATRLGLFG